MAASALHAGERAGASGRPLLARPAVSWNQLSGRGEAEHQRSGAQQKDRSHSAGLPRRRITANPTICRPAAATSIAAEAGSETTLETNPG